jgi:3-hydroxybutyryl-CoA dehydratase
MARTIEKNYKFEDLAVGMSQEHSQTITDAHVLMFAGMSGDTNPVHLDDELAATTSFGKRISHGMLYSIFLSGIFGTRLPGPGALYRSQMLKFRNPVFIGDTVVVRAEIVELIQRTRVIKFETTANVKGKCVMAGEAEIYFP